MKRQSIVFILNLRYYRQLTDFLGIPQGLKYDYDRDKARFSDRVTDEKLLNLIDDIKRCFQIRGNKYTGFGNDNGYETLYKMTVSICKQLFGNDFLISKLNYLRNGKHKKTVTYFYFNEKYFNHIKNFF